MVLTYAVVGQLTAGLMVTPSIRLTSKLGEGGMGSVWVADHLTLETQVAVKFISPSAVRQQSVALERFRREAKAAAQIKNPHVVQIHDYGVMADETPYIVMELLEGESLGDRLRRAGRLPLDEVVDIITQAARALGPAHKAGIIHRDIKPDNLFLVPMDEAVFVKVLDFGIAKLGPSQEQDMTRSGAVIGSPQYMSPEQLRDTKNVDFRADLWSLAVVAGEALTGERVFRADSLAELHVAILTYSYAPPSARLPGACAELDAWFERAFDRDPERRFGSAKQMAAELARIAALPQVGAAGVPARAPLPSAGDATGYGVAQMPSFSEQEQSGTQPFPAGARLAGQPAAAPPASAQPSSAQLAARPPLYSGPGSQAAPGSAQPAARPPLYSGPGSQAAPGSAQPASAQPAPAQPAPAQPSPRQPLYSGPSSQVAPASAQAAARPPLYSGSGSQAVQLAPAEPDPRPLLRSAPDSLTLQGASATQPDAPPTRSRLPLLGAVGGGLAAVALAAALLISFGGDETAPVSAAQSATSTPQPSGSTSPEPEPTAQPSAAAPAGPDSGSSATSSAAPSRTSEPQDPAPRVITPAKPPAKPTASAGPPKKPRCTIVYEIKNGIEVPTRKCQ